MNLLTLFKNHFTGFLPEIYITIVICLLLIFGVFYTTTIKYNKVILITTMNWLTIHSIMITLLLILNNPINNLIIFNNLLIIDDFSILIKSILCLSTIGCLLLSFEYFKDEKLYAFEYSLMFLLTFFGLFLITSAYSLISLYLAIELQSLTLYVMAAFKRNTKFSTEAGLKYFILGAVASGFLLIGCSLMYGFTGMTSYTDFVLLFNSMNNNVSEGIILAILFITIALLFKLAAVPFHMWAPDVYEGAPTIVTAFFAIVPKIAIFSALIRFLNITLYNLINYWQDILYLSAVATLIIATFAALEQKKIKRFLAYSAIGHTGYILIGILTGTPTGIQAAIIYLIIYIIMSIGIFGIILSLRNPITNNKIKYLAELHNLGYNNPLLAMSFAIILFSMAGIPPLAGFISKLYIFLAAIDTSMYLLACLGVAMSVIGSVYYIRLIKIMFFEKTYAYPIFKEMDKEKAILLSLIIFFIIGFFFNPAPLLIFVHKCTMLLCL
jgi:NADH-quinone oxidoreductase subunit N